MQLAVEQIFNLPKPAESGRESVAQGEAGFAEPWVHGERRRAREAGERQISSYSVSVARFAGLLSLAVFPGFRKKRSTLGHTLPPASRAEKCPNSRGQTLTINHQRRRERRRIGQPQQRMSNAR